MAERKPGFVYFFSKALNMEVAVSKTNGTLYTEDKIKYTPRELEIIGAAGGEIPPSVHIVKKFFGGLIIDPDGEKKDGTESTENQE